MRTFERLRERSRTAVPDFEAHGIALERETLEQSEYGLLAEDRAGYGFICRARADPRT